jgi:hypothetical protein
MVKPAAEIRPTGAYDRQMGDGRNESDAVSHELLRPDAAHMMLGDLIDDQAVTVKKDDRFNHTEIASEVGQLALLVPTPTNIALYGSWGSGKTSISKLLRGNLARSKASFVYYDAWRFGGTSLRRNFITNTARELRFRKWRHRDFYEGLYESRSRSRVRLLDVVSAIPLLLATLLASAAICAVALLLGSLLVALVNDVGPLEPFDQVRVKFKEVGPFIAIAAAVFTAVAVLSRREVEAAAPSDEEEFSSRFRKLVQKRLRRNGNPIGWLVRFRIWGMLIARWLWEIVRKQRVGTFPAFPAKQDRVVFFIDELDRCSEKDVVMTLTAIRTFLDEPDCVFVVASDREKLEAALDSELGTAAPQNPNFPYYSTASEFLDKSFAHQLELPPLRGRRLTRFARDLAESQDGGIWAELTAEQKLDSVIYTLIPAHVRSPRRVKVLLNAFAVNSRIAQARGIAHLDRAAEIAKLTSIQIEFQDVFRDMKAAPSLLRWLVEEKEPGDLEGRDRAIYLRHRLDGDGVEHSRLLDAGDDPKSQTEAVKRSDLVRRMEAELRRYLERTRNVTGPQRDLIFLDAAGATFGLEDAEFGELIEEKTPEDPGPMLVKILDRPKSDRIASVRLLASIVEDTIDREQTNVLGVMCQLSANLGEDMSNAAARDVVNCLRRVNLKGDVPIDLLKGGITACLKARDFPLLEKFLGRDDFWVDQENVAWLMRSYQSLPEDHLVRLRREFKGVAEADPLFAVNTGIWAVPDEALSTVLRQSVLDPLHATCEDPGQTADFVEKLNEHLIDRILEGGSGEDAVKPVMAYFLRSDATAVTKVFESRRESLEPSLKSIQWLASFDLEILRRSTPEDWVDRLSRVVNGPKLDTIDRSIGAGCLAAMVGNHSAGDLLGVGVLESVFSRLVDCLAPLSEVQAERVLDAADNSLGFDWSVDDDSLETGMDRHTVVAQLGGLGGEATKKIEAILLSDVIEALMRVTNLNWERTARGVEMMCEELSTDSIAEVWNAIPSFDQSSEPFEAAIEISLRMNLMNRLSKQNLERVLAGSLRTDRIYVVIRDLNNYSGRVFRRWLTLSPAYQDVRRVLELGLEEALIPPRALRDWYVTLTRKQRSAILTLLLKTKTRSIELLSELPKQDFAESEVARAGRTLVLAGSDVAARKQTARRLGLIKFQTATGIQAVTSLMNGLLQGKSAAGDIGVAALMAPATKAGDIPDGLPKKFDRRCKKKKYKLTDLEREALTKASIPLPLNGLKKKSRMEVLKGAGQAAANVVRSITG